MTVISPGLEGGHRPSAGCQIDVLLENYKLGGLAKYRLGYVTLSASIRGARVLLDHQFGHHHGPYAARAGYDFLIRAWAGS